MIEPELIPDGALADVDVGISVSDSADLARLGLDPRHAQLAIGEIARAVLVAGGRLTYGGRIKPSGFTQQLMNEVRRFGTARRSLTICLALSEHRKLSLDELNDADRQLGTWGRLIALNAEGVQISWSDGRGPEGTVIEDIEERQTALSSLRRFITKETQARVLLGGQLAGFQGAMPGLIEEAMLAIEHNQPVYLAAGFGGAAAASAEVLETGSLDWLPPDIPAGQDDPRVVTALAALVGAAAETGWTPGTNGLTRDENQILAASHRPGEVASLVVLGMARLFAPENGPTAPDRQA